jgi:uncharacterized membrane protein YhaH (DUF805 family)
MVQVKLTSFNGNVKRLEFLTSYLANNYIKALPNALPKTVTLQVECDALTLSGFVRGTK